MFESHTSAGILSWIEISRNFWKKYANFCWFCRSKISPENSVESTPVSEGQNQWFWPPKMSGFTKRHSLAETAELENHVFFKKKPLLKNGKNHEKHVLGRNVGIPLGRQKGVKNSKKRCFRPKKGHRIFWYYAIISVFRRFLGENGIFALKRVEKGSKTEFIRRYWGQKCAKNQDFCDFGPRNRRILHRFCPLFWTFFWLLFYAAFPPTFCHFWR